MITNKLFGAYGENLAVKYFKKHKYTIIETNYTNPLGEIDIICFDKKEKIIVFVEVKYRTTTKFGYPREAVNQAKQRKIKMVATMYLKQNNKYNDKIRFDVVEILDEELTHIKNAF